MRIDPTPGRVVYFFSSQDLGWGDHIDGDDQPRAAIVSRVTSPSTVNLCVFDHNGSPHPMPSVRLLQDGEPRMATEVHWAEWMPYQKGQAAKTEALEKANNPLRTTAGGFHMSEPAYYERPPARQQGVGSAAPQDANWMKPKQPAPLGGLTSQQAKQKPLQD